MCGRLCKRGHKKTHVSERGERRRNTLSCNVRSVDNDVVIILINGFEVALFHVPF